MKIFLLEKIKDRIERFDIFELGHSILLYLFLVFIILPIIGNWGWIRRLSIFRNVDSRIAFFDGWTIFYLALAIVFFFAGYRLFTLSRVEGFSKKTLQNPAPNILNSGWDYNRTLFVFAGLVLISFIVKIIIFANGAYFHSSGNPVFAQSPFYSLIGLLNWIGSIALAIAFSYYFYLLRINDARCRVWRILAWSVFAIEFIYGFMSGGRFAAIVPIIIYLISKHYIYEKDLRRVIFAAILILFVLMPLQNFINDPTLLLRGYMGLGEKNQTMREAVPSFVFDNSIKRIDQSQILKAIFQRTDKFLYGRSLLNFFISLGPPRFIWKNKPIINAAGNELGRRYGVLGENDLKTSVGPTVIGDWYLNFGIWGITLGMFFTGALYARIYNYLIQRTNKSLSGVMIYSIFWIHLVKGTEDWIAPVWAGLVKIFVILLVIHFLLIGKAQIANSKSQIAKGP